MAHLIFHIYGHQFIDSNFEWHRILDFEFTHASFRDTFHFSSEATSKIVHWRSVLLTSFQQFTRRKTESCRAYHSAAPYLYLQPIVSLRAFYPRVLQSTIHQILNWFPNLDFVFPSYNSSRGVSKTQYQFYISFPLPQRKQNPCRKSTKFFGLHFSANHSWVPYT